MRPHLRTPRRIRSSISRLSRESNHRESMEYQSPEVVDETKRRTEFVETVSEQRHLRPNFGRQATIKTALHSSRKLCDCESPPPERCALSISLPLPLAMFTVDRNTPSFRLIEQWIPESPTAKLCTDFMYLNCSPMDNNSMFKCVFSEFPWIKNKMRTQQERK